MDTVVFSGFGIEIINRDEAFFVRYDAGEIAVQTREIPIEKDEVDKAKRSEKDAYEVLLRCEARAKQKNREI
jgi:hypothetical protein